jgi:hypothetical protein
MVKKLLLVIAGITIFAGFCYAQINQNNYYEFGGTFMVIAPLSPDYSSIVGGGINFAGITFFNDVFGIGTYANFVYGSTDAVSAIVIDGLIGPVFRVIHGERFSLPIAVGLNVDYALAFSSTATAKGFNIGAGANITAGYRLNEKMHLYGRLQFAYDFLGGGEVYITPSIGIGF